MAKKKRVIVIEDDKDERENLVYLLRGAGFEVDQAADEAEGLKIAGQHWDETDVAVLDMRLYDTDEEIIEEERTGAGIAIKLRQTRNSFPPEFLIFSDRRQVHYYKIALKLGAAGYLYKGEDLVLDVVRHVRVLALRHALNGENPNTAAEVARIAVHSKSKSEAILGFCRGLLNEEFRSCLGADFLVLFTHKDRHTNEDTTQICAHNINFAENGNSLGLSDVDPFYHTLQALAHGQGNMATPFVLESRKLENPEDENHARLYRRFDGAAFLPISLSSDLKLSIGILRNQQTHSPDYNEALALCTVLSQYLRPTVLENILTIWSQWSELRATLNSTARLCLSVGHELSSNLGHETELKSLALDLRETGQYLTQLGLPRSQMKIEEISVPEIIQSEWQWIAPTDYPMELEVSGQCTVEMQRSDLQIVLSRLLQWLAYRGKLMPLDVVAGIDIFCQITDGIASITFEDRSNQLDKKLRQELFAPFTQAVRTPFVEILNRAGGRYLPLYLAKMLVEGRYHGTLEDHSDEIKDRKYGHRIRMQLPAIAT